MKNTIGSPEWFRERAKDPLNIIHDRQTAQSREEFKKKYAPEKLAAMNGAELLDNVFGNGSTMLYDLMDDKEKYINFGSAGAYRYNRIVYCDKAGIWKYKRGQTSRQVTRIEAAEKAEEIRYQLLLIMKCLYSIKKLDTLADYKDLEKNISFAFFYKYTWALKYYQMFFPQWFPCMYGDNTLSRAVDILGLDNHGNDKFANFAEMGLFVQRCGIGSVLMGTVYGQYWGWEETRSTCEAADQNWKDSRIPISLYLAKHRD